MRSRKHQAGVSFVLLAIVVLIGVVIFIAVKMLERHEDNGTRGVETAAHFRLAQDALVAFVAQSERLPCPADPSSDLGVEVPDPATAGATCTFPAGTLPWSTIGASRDSAYDPWGWKISYRVFSGTTGLTQAGGASMVNCDTDNGATPAPSSLAPGGLCGLAHDHTVPQFLAGKGLQVNDFGTLRTDIAYVLVSHGPSGLGAYTAAGVQKALPASPNELANITTTTPATAFFAQGASAAGIDPTAPTFFDDLLAFVSLPELVTRANLAARNWPENFIIGDTMDTATVSAAIGRAVTTGDLSTNRINFGTGANRAQVRGFDAGGNQDLAFDTTDGVPSLGVAGNGGNLISNANNEHMRITFGTTARKAGIALNNFGTSSLGTVLEQVDFTFSGGTAGTVEEIRSGCRPDGGVAAFSIDPGTTFNRIDLKPLAAIPSGNSALGLADFKVCDASAQGCFANLATIANSCSNLMSSASSEYALLTTASSNRTKLGITLNNFGNFTVGATTFAEQVQFKFFDNGVQVGSPIVKSACNTDGGLASYQINFGSNFDQVEVRPITALQTLPALPIAPSQATAFELAEFIGCPSSASSCPTTLAAPANNCP